MSELKNMHRVVVSTSTSIRKLGYALYRLDIEGKTLYLVAMGVTAVGVAVKGVAVMNRFAVRDGVLFDIFPRFPTREEMKEHDGEVVALFLELRKREV